MRAAKARYFSVTRADQVFLPVAVADLLELQGRVLRIVFQQRKLFISRVRMSEDRAW